MTTDEMRIAIAEHLGWKPDTRSGYFINESKQEITPEWCLPNFPEDLNAMHEAEMALFSMKIRGFSAAGIYWNTLTGLVEKKPVWHATARQRAEAFLRCVGKWKE